jgi:putative hydrolase of the HAD superfamily
MTNFGTYRALSFDCYGTLIDWETGIVNALQPWTAWRGVDRSASELLELYGEHESRIEAEHPAMPYPEVLAEVMRHVAASLDLDVSDVECVEFGASVAAWPAFADTALALRRLKERYRLIIVSNVDRASFARSNRRLGVEFDLVITAEDVGSYKPALGHFDALFEQLPTLGVERGELLHVAQSLFHDHEPARRLGLPSVWIDRRHDRDGAGATPHSDVDVAMRYRSLVDFADDALAPT